MRKIWILAPVLCLLLLTGCIQVSALQDLAVVQGVGVDYGEGVYRITLQVFSAEGSGGQTILDPSQQNAKTISCQGKTLTDALSKTALSQGRSFFLGHDRLLVLGAGTRELPLAGLLKALSGSLSLREDVVVLTTSGEAEALLNAEINQGVLPALTLEQTVENAAKAGLIPQVRLLDLTRALADNHRSCVIPMLELAGSGEKELKTVSLTGAALYAGDGFRGKIEGDALSGLLLFEDRVKELPLTVSDPDFGDVGLKVYRCDTKLVPDFSAGIRFTLQVDASAMVMEAAGSLTQEAVSRAEMLLRERLRSCCEKAFSEAVEKNRCDILGLGDVVWRQQPRLWAALRENWTEEVGKLQLDTDIEAKIDRFQSN